MTLRADCEVGHQRIYDAAPQQREGTLATSEARGSTKADCLAQINKSTR